MTGCLDAVGRDYAGTLHDITALAAVRAIDDSNGHATLVAVLSVLGDIARHGHRAAFLAFGRPVLCLCAGQRMRSSPSPTSPTA